MTTLTIPSQITKGEELVIISRKEYEKFLKFPYLAGRQVKRKKLDPGLEEALEDVKAGRLFGPFETVAEFKKEMKRRRV